MKKENIIQSHGSIRKLKAYGAVGVLSVGMMTTVCTVNAKPEEVAGSTVVATATNTATTEVTQTQVDQAQAQVDTSKTAFDQATANVATAVANAQTQVANAEKAKQQADTQLAQDVAEEKSILSNKFCLVLWYGVA